MHVALRFAYDGGSAAFPKGYARQPERGTVEDALIDAARAVGYVDGSWTTGSRTDKGVSASENVATLQLDRTHLKGLLPALQAGLPEGLWVTGAATIPDGFNPRHGAMREYLYVAPKQGEDLSRMQRAAERFEGTHDLSAFARVEPPRDPSRTIEACKITDPGDAWHITVTSPGFLWNQVRRMVDAMLAVGRGDAKPRDIDAALASGTAHSKFGIAAPDGLLLRRVSYQPDLAWESSAGELDARRLHAPWQRNAVTSALLQSLSGSS